MAFSRKQAGGGVEADPSGAGKVDFGPGVQVSEVGGGAFGTFDGFEVGNDLDQVSGNEARGQAQVAHDLHEEPGGIAA